MRAHDKSSNKYILNFAVTKDTIIEPDVLDKLFDKENNCYSLSNVILLNGWHPADELPVIPKDENRILLYCLVDYGEITIPMYLAYAKDFGWVVSEKITVKWWCCPPEED